MQRSTSSVRLRVILQSGACPPPQVKVWGSGVCGSSIPPFSNGASHPEGSGSLTEEGTRNPLLKTTTKTAPTNRPLDSTFQSLGSSTSHSITSPVANKSIEEVVILFDVAAYGRQIAESKIRENHPRLFNRNWMENSFDDAAVAVILQQYFSRRGMTRTMSTFLAELAEMRVLMYPSGAYSRSSEVEETRVENGTKATFHSVSDHSSSSHNEEVSHGVLGPKKGGCLSSTLPTSLLEYTSEVETLRRMFMATLSHPSVLAFSDLFPFQHLASKPLEPSHTGMPQAEDSKGVYDHTQGGIYPKETTDVLDYLMNHHHILLPTGRCALISILNTTLDSLDSILPSRFWALLFFSLRQDILFVIKALQVIDTGLDWLLRSLFDVRRQFSPKKARGNGISHDNSVKEKHSNYTDSDNVFSANASEMFFSPFGMELIEQKLLTYYTNAVLKPFHDIKTSKRAARRYRARKSTDSPEFQKGSIQPHISPHELMSELNDEEDCIPVTSSSPDGISCSGVAGATINEYLLTHIQECRRIAFASPARGGTDNVSSSTAAPWEAVAKILMLDSTPFVAPPSSSTQIALIQSLLTVVLHVMAFFKHMLSSNLAEAQLNNGCVDKDNLGKGVPDAQGGATVRKGKCRNSKEKRSHNSNVKAKTNAPSAATHMVDSSAVELLNWVGRWESLLQRARQQYHKSTWALLQHALDEFNDRIQRRLVRFLRNGNGLVGVEPPGRVGSASDPPNEARRGDSGIFSSLQGNPTGPTTYMEYLLRPNPAPNHSTELPGASKAPPFTHLHQAGAVDSKPEPPAGDPMDRAPNGTTSPLTNAPIHPKRGKGAKGGGPVTGEIAHGEAGLELLLTLGQPTLRATFRRTHAVASLKPQQHITTCAFLAALEEGMRGLPDIGALTTGAFSEQTDPEEVPTEKTTTHKQSRTGVHTPTEARVSVMKKSPSSAVLKSSSKERKRNVPSLLISSPRADGIINEEESRTGDTHSEAALEGGDWAVDEYHLGSIYLKRVYEYMFN
ncbi:unnamed protein product [Phytomonas sp. Hart1]|nr:unnamed protein product [Phytomonas sp. Hart1]|eukprot:CCW65947.1 unnamed protein product [Phytomonas sp. isolate Hart1]